MALLFKIQDPLYTIMSVFQTEDILKTVHVYGGRRWAPGWVNGAGKDKPKKGRHGTSNKRLGVSKNLFKWVSNALLFICGFRQHVVNTCKHGLIDTIKSC